MSYLICESLNALILAHVHSRTLPPFSIARFVEASPMDGSWRESDGVAKEEVFVSSLQSPAPQRKERPQISQWASPKTSVGASL